MCFIIIFVLINHTNTKSKNVSQSKKCRNFCLKNSNILTSRLIRSIIFFSIVTRGNICQGNVIISECSTSLSSLFSRPLFLHPLSIIVRAHIWYAGCKPTETRFKRNSKPAHGYGKCEKPPECDRTRLESNRRVVSRARICGVLTTADFAVMHP